MKKKLLVLGLGLACLVLAGCMNVESKYYIYPDGSGKNATLFSMDPTKMMGMMGGMLKGMMPGGMSGATKNAKDPMEELKKSGVSGISEVNTTFTIYFNDVRKFKSGIKELVWEKKDNLYHLRIVPDLSKMQEQFGSKLPEGATEEQKQSAKMGKMMQMQMLKGMKISFVVVMPGKIVKSNGKIEGREAKWEMTPEELMKEDKLVIEAFSELSSPELGNEFKEFKEESSGANKKFKEAMVPFQETSPTQ